MSLASLPSDVVRHIKLFATEPHPTAKLIKGLLFIDLDCGKITLTEDSADSFLSVRGVTQYYRFDTATSLFKHVRTSPCLYRGRSILTSICDASLGTESHEETIEL